MENNLESNWSRLVYLVSIPSFSSKRGHVTAKHVLIGRKSEMLGNQTFEVPQPLKRTVYTIPSHNSLIRRVAAT